VLCVIVLFNAHAARALGYMFSKWNKAETQTLEHIGVKCRLFFPFRRRGRRPKVSLRPCNCEKTCLSGIWWPRYRRRTQLSRTYSPHHIWRYKNEKNFERIRFVLMVVVIPSFKQNVGILTGESYSLSSVKENFASTDFSASWWRCNNRH
jgi:hypothetical protein